MRPLAFDRHRRHRHGLPAPRTRASFSSSYRRLGGQQEQPEFRPGAWDLVFAGGLVVELDEELHFNRYRLLTLTSSWSDRLPWTEDYQRLCIEREGDCLRAGQWGRRWTSPSAARMFSGGPPADLNGDGAPRWKQRALYDAIKDSIASAEAGVALARVSIWDSVGDMILGAALDGDPVDPRAVRALVERRSAPDRQS